jgi:hypothetical protein
VGVSWAVEETASWDWRGSGLAHEERELWEEEERVCPPATKRTLERFFPLVTSRRTSLQEYGIITLNSNTSNSALEAGRSPFALVLREELPVAGAGESLDSASCPFAFVLPSRKGANQDIISKGADKSSPASIDRRRRASLFFAAQRRKSAGAGPPR